MFTQISQLAGDLPRYQSNLGEKIQTLRGATTASGTLEQASQVLRNLQKELDWRKAPGVSILVGIFNETGQTLDSNPQQIPEGIEFLQGPLSAGVKRICEILSRPQARSKSDQPALAKVG